MIISGSGGIILKWPKSLVSFILCVFCFGLVFFCLVPLQISVKDKNAANNDSDDNNNKKTNLILNLSFLSNLTLDGTDMASLGGLRIMQSISE